MDLNESMSKIEIRSTVFHESYFENDDAKVCFYIGFLKYDILITVFDFIKHYNTRKLSVLSSFQEFILTLIKLRLNAPYQDLCSRFEISVTTISRIFQSLISPMDSRLSSLIVWPERDALLAKVPKCFQDQFLTENCGILRFLRPGNVVMADQGYTIEESVWYYQAKLTIPASTRGKSQLDLIDVEKTRGIANVLIHVERVIGVLCRKYTILQSTRPTSYLTFGSG